MKKVMYRIASIMIIAILIFTSTKIEVLAGASTPNSTVEKAKTITLNKSYSVNMVQNQVLWLKVPVKSLVKNKTHITVETSGVSNNISAFYSVETAKKGTTDASYLSVASPLSYPLAWKGDFYYIKIVAQAAGKITYKVKSEKKEPSMPAYEDEFCTSEALAMSDESIFSLLTGIRSIRDNLLNESAFGKELSDYYYTVSKSISSNLLSDESFRVAMLTNVKNLIPLMNELVLLSEGEESSYVFTQSDFDTILAIKGNVSSRLNTKDNALGEKLWEEFELNQFVGKSLTELVDTKLLSAQYRMSQTTAYSEYIVSYSGNKNISKVLENVNQTLEKNGIDVTLSVRETEDLFGNSRKYILEVVGCSDEKLVETVLEKSKLFDKVSVNYQMSLLTKDVQYGYQWYLENTGQKIPHKDSNGNVKKIAGKKNADIKFVNMTSYLKGKKGSKVVVAVIDTGINYNLADFEGRVNTKDAYNYINNSKDAMDDNNHGTHVSGIIAANANNSYSMAGIDANVIILPIKVLDAKGSGDADSLAKAVKYAADHGANVINMSLGMRKSSGDPVMPDDCEEVEEAMKYAVEEKNITIVVAAGNESQNNLSYPANSEYTISVGAIDNKDKLASFTNTGKGLDLVAPGVSIPSLIKNGEVAFLSGTSMSTPVVTAVVSSMYALDNSLNSKKVMNILKKTCRDLGNKGYDTKFGYGCVNANKALQEVSIKVSSLKISAKSKTLRKGKTITLKVTVSPTYASNKKIKWSSSNPKVAKVDSKGKVTAVKKGTATIKAKALDGSKQIVSCKIRVK